MARFCRGKLPRAFPSEHRPPRGAPTPAHEHHRNLPDRDADHLHRALPGLAARAHRLLRAAGGGADHHRHPARARACWARVYPDYYKFVFNAAGDPVAQRHRLVGGDAVRAGSPASSSTCARPGSTAAKAASPPAWRWACRCSFGSVAALGMLMLPGLDRRAAAQPWQFVLGIGMACAVTALPILILLMEKLEILRQPIGQRILRYASLDDIAIWGVLALILMDWERVGRQARLPASPSRVASVAVPPADGAPARARPLVRRR